MLNIPIRPIVAWPSKENDNPKRSPFRSSYRDTLALLDDELNKASTVDGSWFVEMWVDARDIRLDGQLRANARPNKPGIIFRFSRFSGRRFKRQDGSIRHETQDVSYPCDAFDHWQDNLRAIALSMNSLRRVERYGVFKYDEIISRLALPSAEGSVGTVDTALAFLAEHSGIPVGGLTTPEMLDMAYKRAARKLHPDAPGGDKELFLKLQEAKAVLAAN